MIDEAKQSDNTSQETKEESTTVLADNLEVEAVAVASDSEVNSEAAQPTESSAAEASESESVDQEAQTEVAQAATDESPTEDDSKILETIKQENEALKAQLEERTQQCDSFKSQYIRIAADFENFRKRSTKEKEDLEHQVKGNTITELLSVVDNFERARTQIKPQNDGEMSIHKSYQGVYKQLVDSLKRLGVAAMRPEGQEFDPNLHEAVMREPTDDYPEGVVIEQLMRGYLLGERVLRHAMVKVAAAAEPQETSEAQKSAESEN
ncbi:MULTISPECIES: nucleotide exchange factor GrpE [Moorena]|uniref:Protein GrpE n=1 Tax=Moorena bouillonii PNG TaxID=568701 RepID=A0A1U7N7K6_9CYAN|nr:MULTISPECIES: nucleotide exchange factor GrpE [Moorena]NEO43926.1 nucleotide exchange factor GrpE [Moorena sp. SIO4A3]NEQ79135.1 nucleotide exchange factor GrpE [Moorena sp. SIO2I5]NEP27153.1 nucleotide exchange factor GrpE [Moorena sp. SIO3I6]NEQ62821.1 nucleotide exchange factor GrpE [Moorena sp. SIO4A1]OLT61905.1 nucleotide exchange factor GrpE [Moorena bouillonii PNG]